MPAQPKRRSLYIFLSILLVLLIGVGGWYSYTGKLNPSDFTSNLTRWQQHLVKLFTVKLAPPTIATAPQPEPAPQSAAPFDESLPLPAEQLQQQPVESGSEPAAAEPESPESVTADSAPAIEILDDSTANETAAVQESVANNEISTEIDADAAATTNEITAQLQQLQLQQQQLTNQLAGMQQAVAARQQNERTTQTMLALLRLELAMRNGETYYQQLLTVSELLSVTEVAHRDSLTAIPTTQQLHELLQSLISAARDYEARFSSEQSFWDRFLYLIRFQANQQGELARIPIAVFIQATSDSQQQQLAEQLQAAQLPEQHPLTTWLKEYQLHAKRMQLLDQLWQQANNS